MSDAHARLVYFALEVIADSADASEEEIVAALIRRGADTRSANRVVAMVPLAFGRVLISHIAPIAMSTEFIVKSGDTETILSLKREPLFVEALTIAARMMHEGPRRLFEPASRMSAELDAVNQALEAGASLEGASLRRPVITGFTGAEWSGEAS